MAIFEDNRELASQKRHVGMDKVKGWKKTALSMMGYKDTGEKNWRGRILPSGPSERLLAKRLAKGTDTGKVFKETDDEFAAASLAQLKFAAEVIGTVASGGAGANIAKSGTNLIPDVKTNSSSGIPSNATPPIAPTGQSGNSDIASSNSGSNLMEAVTKQGTQKEIDKLDSGVNALDGGTETDAEFVNKLGKASSELYKDGTIENADGTIDMSQYEKRGFSDFDELTEEQKKLIKEKEKKDKQAKRSETLNKAANSFSNVPLVGSAMDMVAKNRAATLAYEKEADKYKNLKAKNPEFNLL